jgi:hypothetical protein
MLRGHAIAELAQESWSVRIHSSLHEAFGFRLQKALNPPNSLIL